MKKILAIVFVLLGSLEATAQAQQASSPTPQTSPADPIFARYYEATGGKAVWDSIRTYTLERSYKANSSADFDMSVQVSFAAGAMHKEKTILRRTFIYGFNPNDAWLKIPMGSSDKVTKFQTNNLSATERTAMQLEMHDLLVPFHAYTSRRLVASVIGTSQLDTASVTQVELQGTGIRYNLFFSTKTGLLLREIHTTSSQQITINHGAYVRNAQGLLYPSAGTETNSRDRRTMNITSRLTLNAPIDPALLRR
jgi:putative salt-induced outer membrane protein